MKIINIKTIRIDGGTQSRVEINNDIVTEYADAIKAGAEFPAVVVFNDGVDNWLADGFHRFHAHGQAGKTSIAADVRQGTARDAVLYSLGANGTHGLNRTNADKRKAVTTMLADSEWANWSNVAVAKACSVSEGFVRSLRINEVTTPAERTYTTKHGTTAVMKTDAIGNPVRVEINGVVKAIPAPVVEPIAAEPEDYTELDAANDLASEQRHVIESLRAEVAIKHMDGTEEEKQQAAAIIAEQAAYIKTIEATNRALILSRDSLMEEVVQMKRQMAMQRKEIDKLKNNK